MARALGLLFVMLPLLPAWAGEAALPDPTLPPPAVLQALAKSDGDGGAQVSLLQSVILRKGGKPAAIIGGELVELGGRYGDAKLVAVSEDSVVLTGPEGRQVLRLLPMVNKKVYLDSNAGHRNQLRGKSK